MDKFMRKISTLLPALTFLLGIHEGHLTLWRTEDPHPLQIYDIRADSLPPADRLALHRGIRAETREEVWQILENFMD